MKGFRALCPLFAQAPKNMAASTAFFITKHPSPNSKQQLCGKKLPMPKLGFRQEERYPVCGLISLFYSNY